MFDYIEKLKKKSPEEQKRFALIFAFAITALIALSWFFLTFSPQDLSEVEITSQNSEEAIDPTPFQTIGTAFNQLKDALFLIDSEFGKLREKIGQ